MKKLLTALFIWALALVCILSQPVQVQANAENTITNSRATITRSSDSGDIDVPFDPVKKVRRIWVATKPTKLVYRFGEELDITGMVVKATYSDGSSTTVTNYTVSGYSASIIGEQTITVTFGGKTATFIVTVESPDYAYTVENGEATITGYTGAGGEITIPATLGGYPVTTIDDSAFRGASLTSVTIPDSVTTIGDSAFALCDSLSAVTYPGTKCQWEKVSVGTSNDALLNADWTYNEGEHSFTNYVSDDNATYDADGTKTATCDRCDETDTVTDEGSKLIRNGWFKIDGKWYYYKNDVKVTGWFKDGGYWYYMNAEGVMQTGWLKSGNIWYYLKPSGNMATGWAQVGGLWYYFDSNGYMKTGWLQVGGIWYYFKPAGNMATGWCQVGRTWYYFKSSGAMQTGWLKLGNTWYYFHSSGAMATGSVKIGTKTYRFNASGACLNP